MSKIKIGDIFEIDTPKGKGYLHYIHRDSNTGELIRVLQGLYSVTPTNLDKLATSTERYMISFPLSAAVRNKIVVLVGHYPASNFCKPKMMRTQHNIRGEFLGWHLVNTDTWQREFVKTLSPSQKKFSPWGVWNPQLLIENLSNDWSLENWG